MCTRDILDQLCQKGAKILVTYDFTLCDLDVVLRFISDLKRHIVSLFTFPVNSQVVNRGVRKNGAHNLQVMLALHGFLLENTFLEVTALPLW